MGRKPKIPPALKKHRFTLAEGRAAGLTQECLRGRSWRRLAPEIYCWRGWREEPWPLLVAWRRLLPTEAVFGGTTAGWLWRVGTKPLDPVEVILPPTAGVRTRPGLHVRRCTVDPADVTEIRGVRVTSLARTLCDLCARLPMVEALIACDMAMQARHDNPFRLQRRLPGVGRLRQLAALAAPAESPMETRLRWLLLRAGLPSPHVQADLRDSDGRFVGRADLYFPGARLVVEYDGTNHRDRLAEDNRRQNNLLSAGFKLLRFTATDLERPEHVVSLVRTAVREGPR